MTNKTGTAQQRDQPTQLTATEVVELYRLARDLASAKFALGLAIGIHGNGPEHDQAEQRSDAAQIALYDWQREHGLTVDLLHEAQEEVAG